MSIFFVLVSFIVASLVFYLVSRNPDVREVSRSVFFASLLALFIGLALGKFNFLT